MSRAALRVAAYCRVSTDSGDQQNSLANQTRYFREYIRQNPAWELVSIFADEGITGTSTRRRRQFNAMIALAEQGGIDLILTKEVSRFARNTVDALAYTRRLKDIGVGVLFLSDNIDTRENDGEFRLTIMASVAQEESRKTSQRVKWGQRRSMERGVVFGNDSLYGYETKNGKLAVREWEAGTVRRIFYKCVEEEKGTHVIARELQQAGVATPRGGAKWSPAAVRRILTNEKYCGDLLQKKYITPDYLSHKKIRNQGQEEQVYLPEHHEPIVSRELFARAQAALSRRASAGGARHSSRYWCSGRVRCGLCGAPFIPRRAARADGACYLLWCCGARRQGKGCGASSVNHKALAACVRHAFWQLSFDGEAAIHELAAALSAAAPDAEAARRRAEDGVRRKHEKALDAYLAGAITAEELAQARDRCGAALAALAAPRAAEFPPADWEAELRTVCRESDEVLAAVTQQVTVREGVLAIRFYEVPDEFAVRYQVKGRGKSYSAEILSCDVRRPEAGENGVR